MCLSILDYSLYSFTPPHIRLFIYLYPSLFIRGKHSLICFMVYPLCLSFCFLSTSSRLVFILCAYLAVVDTQILPWSLCLPMLVYSPHLLYSSHLPIYSFCSCLFIRDVHLLIWFTLLSLVSVFLFPVYLYLFGYLNHVIYVPSARGSGGCACTILFICECITFMCRCLAMRDYPLYSFTLLLSLAVLSPSFLSFALFLAYLHSWLI